jgi:TolB protein
MDYDGFAGTSWTSNGSINLSPVWDRDGALVWSSYLGGDGAHLWRQQLGQKPSRFLPSVPGMQISAAPSPIDGEIALAVSLDGQTEIFRAYPDGKPVRLTYNPAIEVSPSWSPNGWEIAFTSDRTGYPQVYIMDKDGANLRRVTWVGGYNDQASWSPTGDRIAFARMVGDFQLLTIAPDGSDEKWLGPGEQPKWSPDGRHMVYMRRFNGRSDLWVCDMDGANQHQITFFGDASQPAWSR